MSKQNGDLSNLYSSLNFNAYRNPEPIPTPKSMDALNRLNSSYLGNQSSQEPRNSYDSVWNDSPKSEDILAASLKSNRIPKVDGNFPIGRLLAQTYSYSSDSSSSPNGISSRYSPPRVNNHHGGVFSYNDDSPDSRGLVGSGSSRQSYSYSSESGSLHSRGAVISPSDPGSPTLDDAILIGCRPKNGLNRSYSNGVNSSCRDSTTLSDLMNSLNLNRSFGSRRSTLNGSTGLSPHQNCLSPNNYMMQSALGQNSYSNGSSPNCNPNLQGADLSTLAQLQNACLASQGSLQQLLPNLVDQQNLLGMFGDFRNHMPMSPMNSSDPYALEKAAKLHRNAAAVCEANCTWSGLLPLRSHKNPFYSCKVFLGGVPWDVTEIALKQAFMQFGSIQVEWPGKDNSANPPKGFVYVLFENEKQVKSLLANCTQDFTSDNYYFKISSRRMRQKEVQVIPWVLSDSNYVRCPSFQLDPAKTVFVGALHGMLSAEGLANIMNDLFGGVVYSGIDTDKHKYPIGSGRVTFNNVQSYRKAVKAAFIEIKAPKFTKKVQVDPYLADSICMMCNLQQAPYFCRDDSCFKYFCRACWLINHPADVKSHMPLMRNSRLRSSTTCNRLL